MAQQDEQRQHDGVDNTIKDPETWVTGDEPMTEAQRGFLQALAEQTGASFDENLNKAEASARIEELRGQAAQGGGAQNTIKDPETWNTGNDPMTGAQESYLKTLAHEAGEQIDPNMSKADASKKIEELQAQTGRSAQ